MLFRRHSTAHHHHCNFINLCALCVFVFFFLLSAYADFSVSFCVFLHKKKFCFIANSATFFTIINYL